MLDNIVNVLLCKEFSFMQRIFCFTSNQQLWCMLLDFLFGGGWGDFYYRTKMCPATFMPGTNNETIICRPIHNWYVWTVCGKDSISDKISENKENHLAPYSDRNYHETNLIKGTIWNTTPEGMNPSKSSGFLENHYNTARYYGLISATLNGGANNTPLPRHT